MANIELPIRSDLPSYEFVSELDGENYRFRFRWNERAAVWVMDIATPEGVDIVAGLPVYTNLSLLHQFVTDGLPPGRLVAVDTSGANADATRDNFGGETGTIRLIYEEAEA